MTSSALQFILTAVRVNDSARRREELLALLHDLNDGVAVPQLAFQHGLIPLLYTRLKETVWADLPQDLKTAIAAAHRKNAVHSLALTGELVQLVKLLQGQGLFNLPYKGPVLAAQLYGDVAMRQYGDLDVVISKATWAKVNTLLIENRWLPHHELPASQESLYQHAYNEHAYISAQNTLLELHWAFAEPRYSFPFSIEAMQARLTSVTVADTAMAAPAPEDLLLILCFHGAKHKWERLGWIADIAQLIAVTPQFDWERLLTQACGLGCERLLHLSLSLAASLGNAPLPEKIQHLIQSDSKARKLAAEISQRLQRDNADEIGMWELLFFHLQMRERWRDQLLYCYHLLFRTTPEDWAMLPFVLPASLSFLYYPARLVRLLRKYLLRQKI